MALYAIGDLHLSFANNKPMDVFGGAWVGYVDKLREALAVIAPSDTTLLLGDLSWAMDMAGAKEDFAFINAIPGRKIIIKGNHDYWWTTAAKFYSFCEENGFSDMYILHNNSYEYEDIAICGTRGWFFEEDAKAGSHNDKVFKRELIRLETSLKAGGDREKYCILHYPPRYRGYECPEILALLKAYGVTLCCYGHLHGASHRLAIEGLHDGVDFRLCAADYTKFRPLRLK
ncbi:MAG: metallophosphoesterase [Oscillospiraceae bacterium]|jgi:predicted phosphohydrolase|nr:metallophosphoesterase [Oscillospiraceae bacterium]